MQNRIHTARSAASVVGPIATNVAITTVLATTLASTFISTASADFTTRRWTSETNYALTISHMTDFDQNRSGLPGGGANYCYPTATANLFAYIAQHGYAYCAPGNFDWQSNSNHTRATEFIDKLGDLMDTGASTGTEHNKGYRGAREMLRDEVGSRFVIEEENWTIFNVVSLKEMTKQSIDDRAVQSFCYGKYEVLGTNDCGERAIKRDGGHCMTFVGASRSGSTRDITYHDPDSTTDSTSTQSTFTATTKDCPWVDDLVVFPTLTGSCWGFNQSMSRIMRSTDDGYLRLIDRRLAIRPASSYSWGSYEGFADGGVEIRTDSLGWGEDDGGVRASRVSSTIIGNPSKASLIVSPSGVPYFVVPGAQGGLFVEVRGDQGAAIVRVPMQLLGVNTVDDAVFAGDRTLVVRSGRLIRAIAHLDAGLPGEDDNKPFIAWGAEAPFDVAKLVASQRGQHVGGAPHSVIAFSGDLRAAFEVSGDPEIDPRSFSIPAQIPLNPQLIGDTTIVEDSMGTLWFAQPGNAGVAALTVDGMVIVEELPVDALKGLAIDDRDNLLVVDGGIVRCFSHSPKGLVETGADGSPFAGQQVGRGFTVSRSTTNFEARFHVGAGWRDVIDVELTARPGDLDGDGMVGPQDLAAVLGAWGAGNASAADIDGDGVVGPQDLAVVLANWGS